MKPKSHIFRGIEYRILWRKPKGQPSGTGGTCDPPGKHKPAIEIHPSLGGFDKMRVLVDEAIHACYFDLDNDAVAESSHAIASFLWSCGARMIEEDSN